MITINMSEKKKKILLLSDDFRMSSGVATMSRELVMGTSKKYHWVQMGGAIKHPEAGKIIDLTQATNEMNKNNDSYVKIYCVNGYGDENTLFQVIGLENPDVIMHFTDPRFWGWLYSLERQIRSKIPLVYLDIWDAPPYPMWNKPFYNSCDALMSISKQTDMINLAVSGAENCCRIEGWYDKNYNLIPWVDIKKSEFNNEERKQEVCQ